MNKNPSHTIILYYYFFSKEVLVRLIWIGSLFDLKTNVETSFLIIKKIAKDHVIEKKLNFV